MSKLSPKWERFAQYVAGGGTYAGGYQEAGYKGKSHRQNGFELSRKPAVAARIKELEAMHIHDIGVTARATFEEICHIAFLDPTEAFQKKGKGTRAKWVMKELDQMPLNVRKAIASIKYSSRGGFELKFHNKDAALDKLMRAQGAYEKDNRQAAPSYVFDFAKNRDVPEPVTSEADIVDPLAEQD